MDFDIFEYSPKNVSFCYLFVPILRVSQLSVLFWFQFLRVSQQHFSKKLKHYFLRHCKYLKAKYEVTMGDTVDRARFSSLQILCSNRKERGDVGEGLG